MQFKRAALIIGLALIFFAVILPFFNDSGKLNKKSSQLRFSFMALFYLATSAVLIGVCNQWHALLGNDKASWWFSAVGAEWGLEEDYIQINAGESYQIKLQTQGANFLFRLPPAKYSSENPDLLYVNEEGLVWAALPNFGAEKTTGVINVEIGGVTRKVYLTLFDPYYYEESPYYELIGNYKVRPLVLKTAVPECTGFKLHIDYTNELEEALAEKIIDVWVSSGGFEDWKYVGYSDISDLSISRLKSNMKTGKLILNTPMKVKKIALLPRSANNPEISVRFDIEFEKTPVAESISTDIAED